MSGQAQALVSELNGTLRTVSRTRHLEMLREMTDLFLASAPHCTQELKEIFDAVIKRLAQNISSRDLIELAKRLCTMDDAPADTIAQLSTCDDINVAGPILEHSTVLTDNDLVVVAKTKGQGHLMAIAGRRHIASIVTDVLVERGDTNVKHKVLGNGGAEISEFGFACLISAASKDKQLAAIVSKREDIPEELQSFLNVALG